MWAEDRSCLQWLDSQTESSVVYVSLGSVTVLKREQFSELALGLELCEKPILWVIRRDLIDGNDAPIEFPSGYLDRMQSRLCCVAWAPQKEVLLHRAVGGFFTHHGWNSTVESLAAGVPMLGWPYFADQMTNARLCSDVWNAGLRFGGARKRLISRAEVDEKVRSLMRPDAAFREKIEQFREIVRRGVREGGSSNLHLEEVLCRVSAL
jgi:UDP:flavonoid glycosyltransferase YjiC (YdhE family)